MPIEWDDEEQKYKFKGYGVVSSDEEDNSGLTGDEAIELGILDEKDFLEAQKNAEEGQKRLNKKHENILTKADDLFGYVSPIPKDKDYEEGQNIFDHIGDGFRAVGNEVSHIWQRQKTYDGALSFLNWLPEERAFEAKNKTGEVMTYLTRYGLSIFGVGKVGAILKAPKLINGIAKAGKFGQGVAKAMSGTGKFITAEFKALEAAEDASKLTKIGKGTAKIALSGQIEGFIGDFIVGRPEEGEGLIGDAFNSDNPILQYFTTNTNDSGLEWRFKNALQGLILGIPLGFVSHGVTKMIMSQADKIKHLKNFFNAKSEKEAVNAINNYRATEAGEQNMLRGQALIDTVSNVFEQAEREGTEDIESFVLNSELLETANKDDVVNILNKLQKGQQVYANTDGTFSISVTKWREAADVTAEELAEQTENNGIKFMNDAVKDTWEERKILNPGEEIISVANKTNPKAKDTYIINENAANKVIKHYEGKWDLPENSIKIKTGKLPEGIKAQSTKIEVDNTKKIEASNKKLNDLKTKLDTKKKDVSKKLQYKKKQLQVDILTNRLKKLKSYNKTLTDEGKPEVTYNKVQAGQAKKDIQNKLQELKEYIGNKNNLYFVKRRKNTFSKQQLVDDLSFNAIRASEAFNEYIDALKKDPAEALNNINKYADKIERYSNSIGDEFEGEIWKKFYEAQSLADDILQVDKNLHKSTKVRVSDDINVLERKLEIAEKELKASEDKLTNHSDILKLQQDITDTQKELERLNKKLPSNVVITINPNLAKDEQYAILRSELEHARDYLKGTEPKDADITGSGTHFSRYKGDNEAEASLDYIRRKAGKRAGKVVTEENLKKLNNYDFEETKSTAFGEQMPDEEPYTMYVMKDKSGNRLSHIRYTKEPDGSIFIDWMQRHSSVSGDGRKAVASLMQKYPDKEFHWWAKNDNSVHSYEEFVKEYPELAERVKFKDIRYSNKGVDDLFSQSYNKSSKEGLNEAGSNSSQYDRGNGRNISGENQNTGTGNVSETQQSNTNGISKSSNTERIEPSGSGNNVGRNESKRISDNSEEPVSGTNIKRGNENEVGGTVERERNSSTEQQLDTRPLADRQANVTSTQNAFNTLREVEESMRADKITWKVNLNDAENVYNSLTQAGYTNIQGLKQAISKGDVEYVNMVVGKQIAFERILSDLHVRLGQLGEHNIKEIDEIVKSIEYYSDVIRQLAGAYGRGLNAQKLVNKVRGIFSLSTMEELGIDKMADLLSVDLKSLNFTEGLPKVKQKAYDLFSKYANGQFMQQINSDTSVAKAFDEWLDKLLKEQINDPKELRLRLNEFAASVKRQDLLKILQATPDSAMLAKVINRHPIQSGLAAYCIHNMLSAPGTLAANILSGGVNMGYFPFVKVLGGLISSDEGLTKEGIYQLKGTFDAFSDAMQMAVQAFKTGNGQMISFGRPSVNERGSDIGLMFGGGALGEGNATDKIFRILGIMTRAMGASDEFMTQLGYRSITRAKGLVEAEKLAVQCGRQGDYKWIEEQAAKYFNNSFDEAGRPLDINAFAEAREMIYQTPLNGKYYDPKTQTMQQVKEQSVLMGISEAAMLACERYPALKLLIPFVRTPSNIAQMNMEHHIYGLLSSSQRKLIMSDTREGAIARAKLCFGIASTVFATGLAAQGFITGSPPFDNKEREALFKTGWHPYSINLGGKYYSYAKYEPLSTVLGFGADLFHLWNNYDKDETFIDNMGRMSQEGLKAVLASTFDKTSFMSSTEQIGNLLKFVHGTDDIQSEHLARNLQMFLPYSNAVQQLSTVGERGDTKPSCFAEGLRNKYFNRGLGDYKRNIWGERQDVYNFILTSGSKGLDENRPEDEELQRLASLGWHPSELGNNELGTTVHYKDFKNKETKKSFYDAMLQEMSEAEIGGQTLREAVAELVQSEYYQTAPDGIGELWAKDKTTKVAQLRALFGMYKKYARNKVITEQGDNFVNKEGLTASEQREADRDEMERIRAEQSLQDIVNNIRSFN